MRVLFTCLLACLLFNVVAQKASNQLRHFSMNWSSGHIVFKSGDTVNCLVRYNITASHATLQIREEDYTLTISPKDLKSFSFYDSAKARQRTFTSMKLDRPGNEVFLEDVYVDSKFRILNHKTYGIPYEYLEYTRFISRPTQISRKYILDVSNGQLLPASRENVLRLLQNRRNEVLSYIDQHHLKFKKLSDYIAVLQFHNSLY